MTACTHVEWVWYKVAERTQRVTRHGDVCSVLNELFSIRNYVYTLKRCRWLERRDQMHVLFYKIFLFPSHSIFTKHFVVSHTGCNKCRWRLILIQVSCMPSCVFPLSSPSPPPSALSLHASGLCSFFLQHTHTHVSCYCMPVSFHLSAHPPTPEVSRHFMQVHCFLSLLHTHLKSPVTACQCCVSSISLSQINTYMSWYCMPAPWGVPLSFFLSLSLSL